MFVQCTISSLASLTSPVSNDLFELLDPSTNLLLVCAKNTSYTRLEPPTLPPPIRIISLDKGVPALLLKAGAALKMKDR